MILLEEINFHPLNSTKYNIHKELLSEENICIVPILNVSL